MENIQNAYHQKKKTKKEKEKEKKKERIKRTKRREEIKCEHSIYRNYYKLSLARLNEFGYLRDVWSDINKCRLVDIWRGRESVIKRKSNRSWPINKSGWLNSRVSQRLAFGLVNKGDLHRVFTRYAYRDWRIRRFTHSLSTGWYLRWNCPWRDVLSIIARIFEVDVPSWFKDVLIMSFSYLTTRIREICLEFIRLIVIFYDTNLSIIIYVTVSHNFVK